MMQQQKKQPVKYKVLNIVITVLILGAILLLGGFAIFSEKEQTTSKVSYISIEDSSSSSESTQESEPSSKPATSQKSETEKTPKPKKESVASSEEEEPIQEIIKVNINTATMEDLVHIDGISEHMAEVILTYRELAGGFTDISDLLKIKGMPLNREEIAEYFYCE